MMPGHEWDYQVGVNYEKSNLVFSNSIEKPHLTFSIGGSAYFLIGGDISFSFDFDKFLDEVKSE